MNYKETKDNLVKEYQQIQQQVQQTQQQLQQLSTRQLQIQGKLQLIDEIEKEPKDKKEEKKA